MKTVNDVSTNFLHHLSTLYDANEVNSLCMIVLSDVTGISSAKIKAFPEMEIAASDAEKIEGVLTRLETGEPVQYILGHTEFYGLPFKVNPSVLIPRPETEELVEWSIKSWQPAPGRSQKPYHILDVGTGSGCIAISLKKNLKDVQLYAIDISSDALKTAKENAELNEVDVNFIQDDMLNLKSEIRDSKFEIIISNPPYVTLDDKRQMHTNVTDFEPHAALFVPEDDPLVFYKAIADFALLHLEKGGLLFFEINESYGEQTVELLSDNKFNNIELRKDMSGKYRMIKAAYTEN